MTRKELSEKVFQECLNGKIKLFGEIFSEPLQVNILSDKGAGYIAKILVNFNGPFFKKIEMRGYDSRAEAETESVQRVVDYFKDLVSPNLVNYDRFSKIISLKKV